MLSSFTGLPQSSPTIPDTLGTWHIWQEILVTWASRNPPAAPRCGERPWQLAHATLTSGRSLATMSDSACPLAILCLVVRWQAVHGSPAAAWTSLVGVYGVPRL